MPEPWIPYWIPNAAWSHENETCYCYPSNCFFSENVEYPQTAKKIIGKMIWKMRFLTIKLGGSPLGLQVTPSISGQTKSTYTSPKFKLYIYICVCGYHCISCISWYHIISHQFPNLYSHEAWPVAPTSCSTAWLPIQSPRPELESGRPSGKKQRGRKTWKNVGKIWKHIWKTAHYCEKNMENYGKTWRKMGRTRTARKMGKPYFVWNYISKTLRNGQTTIGNSEELFFCSCLQELLCACYRLKKLRAKNLINIEITETSQEIDEPATLSRAYGDGTEKKTDKYSQQHPTSKPTASCMSQSLMVNTTLNPPRVIRGHRNSFVLLLLLSP